jgi:peptide/nickel transport system permease protein
VAQYALRRLLLIIPTLFGVSTIVFFILEAVPADPAIMILGQQATPEQLERLRDQMGLNDPVLTRYVRWLGGVARGDFGTSLTDGRDVFAVALGRMPATLMLLLTSVSLAIAIGLPLGILSAVRPNGFLDLASRTLALLGLSVPNFWLALLLILVFSYHWRLLPIGGYGSAAHLVLPTVALGGSMAAVLMRMTRSAILDTMQSDYVRTARSKGVPERVVLTKHALRNALLPIVTIVGLDIGYMLGGTVVIEAIFEWPGVGRYAYLKMLQRDYPAIMANLFLFAFLFSIVNLLTDLTYGLFDPRVKYV